MGKCLSCCEQQPDEDSRVKQSKPKGGDAAASPPGNYEGSSSAAVSLEAGSHGQRARSNDNDGERSGSGRTSAAAPACDKAPRGMFYPRIPPIQRSGHGRDKECSEPKILAFYEQYRDAHEDAILSEGIERLCQDLEVRPEEFRVLVLAWKFKAETMCRFSRAEFLGGCRALRVCSAKGIQARFPDMLREVDEDAEQFKELYRFTFGFGLDAEVGQRILPADMAALLWRLVFSRREPPLLRRWLAFLECHPGVRGVPRDTWNMFLNFLETVGDDLAQYDDAEAWPSLFDDFVEYVQYENDQTNQNVVVQRKDDNDRRIS